MTTLNSFYATANALGNLDQRRWALGAGYRLGEYARLGYSIPAGRALVLAAPQYANGLTAAALTAAYNAIDDVGLGAAFAPTDLGASLLANWKPESLIVGAVSSWADSSGSARTLTQATGANQPVFAAAQQNGLGAVAFDGTNDYLATAAFASPTSGASVFVVQKLTAVNQYRTVLCHAAAATWVSPFARVLARASDTTAGAAWQWIVEDASVGANGVNDSVAAATGAWQIVEFHYDQANQWIVKAGTTAVTAARTGLLTSSTQPVFVGADTSLADNFAGQVGEIVYCSQLNGTQIGQVRSYLQGRWAL